MEFVEPFFPDRRLQILCFEVFFSLEMITVFAPEVAIVSGVNFREIFCFEYNSLYVKPQEVQKCLCVFFHKKITSAAIVKAFLILWNCVLGQMRALCVKR